MKGLPFEVVRNPAAVAYGFRVVHFSNRVHYLPCISLSFRWLNDRRLVLETNGNTGACSVPHTTYQSLPRNLDMESERALE